MRKTPAIWPRSNREWGRKWTDPWNCSEVLAVKQYCPRPTETERWRIQSDETIC